MNAVFFAHAAEFRAWLEANHASAIELIVGFYKKGARKSGITYEESVDEALCFGWIDGIVRGIDGERYCHRFTPRKRGSIWSNVNVGHIERLTKAGRMHAAGEAAFAARKPEKTGVYLFEAKTTPTLPPKFRRTFEAQRAAWLFFQAQPPGYQRLSIRWVVSAKQEATRERRLQQLIAASAARRRLW